MGREARGHSDNLNIHIQGRVVFIRLGQVEEVDSVLNGAQEDFRLDTLISRGF